MPLLLIIFGLITPRLVLVLAALAGVFQGVWTSMLWPMLGFFFLPYTTLAYGLAFAYGPGVHGIWLVAVILAAAVDLGAAEARLATIAVRDRSYMGDASLIWLPEKSSVRCTGGPRIR